MYTTDVEDRNPGDGCRQPVPEQTPTATGFSSFDVIPGRSPITSEVRNFSKSCDAKNALRKLSADKPIERVKVARRGIDAEQANALARLLQELSIAPAVPDTVPKFPWKVEGVSVYKPRAKCRDQDPWVIVFSLPGTRKRFQKRLSPHAGEAYKLATELAAARKAAAAAAKDSALPRLPEALQRTIDRDLGDCRKYLEAKARTQRQCDEVFNRCTKLIKLCSFHRIDTINAHQLELIVAQKLRAEQGLSLCTVNKYLKSLRQFTRWCAKPKIGKLRSDPLADVELYNETTDPVHTRRPLTHDECRRLLRSAAGGDDYKWWNNKITGCDRELIYLLALTTGLRANEIRTLQISDFHFDGDSPYIEIRASNSKHRKGDEQPLRADVARRIHAHLGARPAGEHLFPDFPDKAVQMLKFDLAAATPAIDYKTPRGFADFHSLRHTFGTELGRSGASIKTVQRLMRHSDVRLTARYMHGTSADDTIALNNLPDLSTPAEPGKVSEAGV